MADEQEVDHRILVLEQLTLEMLRRTYVFRRKQIIRALYERFSYSKPLLEIIRYTELELKAPKRDDVTKFADFRAHRSDLDRAYADERKATKGQVPHPMSD